MKKLFLIIMSAVMLSSVTASAAEFNDIHGHWAEAVINRLADGGVVSGISAGEFAPENTVTRAQYLKMIMNAVGISEEPCSTDMCLDAAKGEWYCGYLNSALRKGLIPDEMITDYKAEIVQNAEGTEASIVYSGKFNANQPINREEMAFITVSMYQYILNAKTMQSMVEPSNISFTDKEEISLWTVSGVELAAANGIITGMDDGSFKPKETATRAQAATIIGRVLDKMGK